LGAGLALLGLAPAMLVGCDATRRDWRTCYHVSDCGKGRVCNQATHLCENAMDGGAGDSGLSEAPTDGASPASSLDVAISADTTTADAGSGESMVVPRPDVALDVALDGAGEAALDSAGGGGDTTPGIVPDAPGDAFVVTVEVGSDAAVDTRVADAPGSCASDEDCASPAPFCFDHRCVACRTSAECQGGTPICAGSHACVSCALADAGCPAALPACEPVSGRCVACASNDDCTVATRPICDTKTYVCAACASDEQCAAAGPAVCMAHLDGHCATDAETIYVGGTGAVACSDTAANAGSARTPYCSAQNGVLAARNRSRPLVVLTGALAGGFSGVVFSSPLTVVGKDAVLTPAAASDGIGLTEGELYLRAVKVVGSTADRTRIGISAVASSGATLALHMDGCTVADNPGGGILLDGAAFDIRDTAITGNGPGQTSDGVTFGGIRVDRLAAAGPASLTRVTISDNLAPGLSCAASIQGSSVLASGNVPLDILDSCGVVPCSPAGPACGAAE
jgi:hypothetical protein